VSITLADIATKLARRNAGVTDKQSQLLDMLFAGRPDKQILRDLNITPAALKSRKRDLRLKLAARNTFQAAAIAAKRGLL